MKRTVSEKRTPEYPTVSINSNYLRHELSEAWNGLKDQGFDQAPRLQLKLTVPPIDHAENIVEEMDSNSVYALIDGSNGEYRENEIISLEYDLSVPRDLNDTLQGIESAIEENGYEKKFWKIDGVYTPMQRTYEDAVDDLVDYANSMQVYPSVLIDMGLDSNATVGWFSKAPLNDEVQFGYRAFPNREFQNDSIQSEEDVVKVLERITGERDDEINDHDLSAEETEKLLDLEQSMAKYNLL